MFDRSAEDYDGFYKTALGDFVDKIEKDLMKEIARPKPGEKALDLGCGTGNYTFWLYEQGCSVIGIDISKKMLDTAKIKKHADKVAFLHGDIACLPFEKETFDLVIGNIVLEFTEKPKEIVKEAMRVVKKGGRIVFGFIGKESAWGRKYEEKGKRDEMSVFYHARFFTVDEIKKLYEVGPDDIKYGLYVTEREFSETKEAFELEKKRRRTYPPEQAGYIAAKWVKEMHC